MFDRELMTFVQARCVVRCAGTGVSGSRKRSSARPAASSGTRCRKSRLPNRECFKRRFEFTPVPVRCGQELRLPNGGLRGRDCDLDCCWLLAGNHLTVDDAAGWSVVAHGAGKVLKGLAPEVNSVHDLIPVKHRNGHAPLREGRVHVGRRRGELDECVAQAGEDLAALARRHARVVPHELRREADVHPWAKGTITQELRW